MLKSKFMLAIESDFAKQEVDGDDITQWLEECFHRAVHDVFEDFMTGDEFTQLVLERLYCEADDFESIKEFNDLGDIKISITDDEITEPFSPPLHKHQHKKLPKDQKDLSEFV